MVALLLNLYPYPLCNYLTKVVQAYAEQQRGYCITLVYSVLDVHLCD